MVAPIEAACSDERVQRARLRRKGGRGDARRPRLTWRRTLARVPEHVYGYSMPSLPEDLVARRLQGQLDGMRALLDEPEEKHLAHLLVEHHPYAVEALEMLRRQQR